MRQILISGLLALAAFVGEAKTFVHLEETENPNRRTAVERMMTFSNSLNSYRIRLRTLHVDPKHPWLSCALDFYNRRKCGFCLLAAWLSVRVNGIALGRIVLKPDDVRPYAAADRQGFDIAMNFDGAHLVLRLYMREDSPCLWGELLPQDFGSDRVREVEITLTACPSYVDPNGKQKGCCRFSDYHRRIFTAARTLDEGSPRKGVAVGPEDGWFVLGDAEYDGSEDGKGCGPCFATVDFSGVGEAKARVTDAWISSLVISMKPGAERLGFGIWECPGVRLSNDELCRRVRAGGSAYRFNHHREQ